MIDFLPRLKQLNILMLAQNTIRSWDNNGFIKTIRVNGSVTGHRRYDVSSFNGKVSLSKTTDVVESLSKHQQGAIYCRVSSHHQKDDLERQVKSLSSLYPKFEIFKDVGSGINFKRPNFFKLIQKSLNGDFNQIIVAHKDRFTRFGFEFFEWLFDKYQVSLVVLDQEQFKTPEQELAEDLLSIVHVFSCRQNGRRKYVQATNDVDSKSSTVEKISKYPESGSNSPVKKTTKKKTYK